VGGVAIAIVMLGLALVGGQDPWMALKGAGAPFLGERAMQPGFDGLAVALGVICHMAVSAVWGVGFGVLFYGLSRPATVGAGALWGLVSWLVMFYVVLPLVGLGDMAASAPLAPVIVEHIAFGLAVAVGFLPYQRRIPHEIARPRSYGRTTGPVAP
jgi:hypothetical protein